MGATWTNKNWDVQGKKGLDQVISPMTKVMTGQLICPPRQSSQGNGFFVKRFTY